MTRSVLPVLALLLGACRVAEPSGPEPVATALPFATELALTTDRVWWLESIERGQGQRLVSADKQTLELTVVATEPSCAGRLAASGDALYFTACAELRRADGSAVATLPSVPHALAAAGNVFWADDTSIHELTPQGVEVSVRAVGELTYGVALAADDSHVWFLVRFEGRLARMRRSDGVVEPVSTLAGDSGPVLCHDGTLLYWGLNGYLERIEKSSLAKRKLDAPYTSAGDCAAFGGAMFWAARSGAVMQQGESGSTVWAADQPQVLHVVADAAHVYWVTAGTGGEDGVLMRQARK